MRMSSLVMLIGLLLQTAAQVSSAEPVHLDVLEGRPVRLNATHHEDSSMVMWWTHNTTRQILTYSPGSQKPFMYEEYQKKVDFSTTDFSVTLNDARKSDGGLYEAWRNKYNGLAATTDTYHLSVHEHAAVPILTVLSNQSSPDSCHVTLSCTGSDVSLTSNCSRTSNTNHTIVCSQEGGKRFLSISSNQSTVSCNHSNPVSWSLDTIELQPLCPFYGEGPSSPAGLSPCQLKAVVLSIILFAMTSAVIGVHTREKLRRKKGSTLS